MQVTGDLVFVSLQLILLNFVGHRKQIFEITDGPLPISGTEMIMDSQVPDPMLMVPQGM